MDALYPVIGGRRLICHSEVDTLHEPYALILDTNVIKDIGSFYFGHRQISPKLRQLLSYIRSQCRATRMSLGAAGVCYRLGLTELSLKRNNGVNYSQFRNYGSAVCKLITCGEDEFAWICDTTPSYAYSYDSNIDETVDSCVSLESGYLPIFYGSILYLLAIQLEKTSHQKTIDESINQFERFYKWAHDDLGFITALPTLLALYQLLGKDGNSKETRYRGNARHLTKFDPNKITKPSELANCAWNAAWDILFLMRLSDYNTGEVLRREGKDPHSIPTVLISKDYDPAWLSFSTNPLGELYTADGSTTLPYFESSSDFFDLFHVMSKDQRAAFWKRLNAVKTSCSRKTEDPIERTNHSIIAVHELENHLGIDPTRFPSLENRYQIIHL